jgi:cell division protease FtsH
MALANIINFHYNNSIKNNLKVMKNLVKNIFVIVLVFMIIASIFSFYDNEAVERKEVGIATIAEQIENEEVDKIVIEGNKVKVDLKNGTKLISQKEPTESFSQALNNYGVDPQKARKIPTNIKDDTGATFWLSAILPIFLPIIFIFVLFWFIMRGVQGANNRALGFGQSLAREKKPDKDQKPEATFKDVAGAKEAKTELEEVVEFLKTPKKFANMGAKIPKGVLLVGPPGTGKTLLAKAVSGEAKVPFFHMSGSEFVEMFVGVGASRARDLFKKAKKNAPCIVFIDELDAVGRRRGAGLGGSHDEREQTLNQILTEMDGFEPNSGVIVLAATNRPDVLDPALLRPGRFDRQVVLDLPDINDREEILKIHSRKKPLAKDVSLRQVAERTPGFSGADLANLLNEAAILAARRNKKQVTEDEVLESIDKVLLGPQRKSHILSSKEKKITAYHEAGHALVSHILPNADPVQKVSIISRGRAAGFTMNLPEKDKHMHTRSEYIDNLAVLLAGHTVEKEIFGDITTGASNDLKRATQLAKNLVTQWGMSEKMTPRTYGEHEEMIFLGKSIHEQRDYSEKVAEEIDSEISQLIEQAIKTAKTVIHDYKDKLDKIASELLKYETLEKGHFEGIFDPKKLKEWQAKQKEKAMQRKKEVEAAAKAAALAKAAVAKKSQPAEKNKLPKEIEIKQKLEQAKRERKFG